MKIFVTGASGFVGGAAASALARGHEVVAMARSERSADRVRATGATPVTCELGRVAPEHLTGCDAVVHAAAFVESWGSRDDFWTANVEGTQQLLDVAKRSGVRRFVHIGTEAVLFAGQDMHDIDETYPYPARTPFLYSETKAEAERRVLAANGPTFTTISLRPRFIWGPGDLTILEATKELVADGRYMWIDGGQARTSTVHIHNVVRAIELALEHGTGGEAYFITDDEVHTFRDFMTRYAATAGIDLPARNLPGWAARALATVLETVWRTFGLGGQPPLTRFVACLMSSECTLRIGKARRDLGYAPVVSVDAGLEALRGG
jgi:nucleoside-diphosphate-sugar epimerase